MREYLFKQGVFDQPHHDTCILNRRCEVKNNSKLSHASFQLLLLIAIALVLSLVPLKPAFAQSVTTVKTNQTLCLDVHWPDYDNRNNGGKVQIWGCNNQPNQNWEYNAWTRELKLAGTNLCLDIHGTDYNNKTLGGRVWMWTCHGGINQKWTWSHSSESLVADNGQCLDVHWGDWEYRSNGGRVQMWECNGQGNQRWNRPTTNPHRANAPCIGGGSCLPLPDTAHDCWKNLNCTVHEINAWDIQQRTEWFEKSVLRYGPAQGFADGSVGNWRNNWFSNIFGVLQLVQEYQGSGRLGSAAFNLTDAFILNAVQNGLKYHLTGRHENFDLGEEFAKGHWWREFFREAASANPNVSTMRKRWGVAEQIATNEGRWRVWWTPGMRFTSEESQLLLWVGDFYRHAVANRDSLAIRAIEMFASFDPRNSDDLVRFGRILLNDASNQGGGVIWFDIGRWIDDNIFGPFVQAGIPLATLTQFESWVCQDSWASRFSRSTGTECLDSPLYGTHR